MPFISSIRGNFSGIGRGRFVRDGLTQSTAGFSAAQIKQDTGTNVNGPYWIKASDDAPAQEVYCLMDSTYDGGGWQIIAHNSADAVVATATHYPRPTASATFTGTDGPNSYSTSGRWSINALDMKIKDFVVATYTTNFIDITSYTYGKFDTFTTLPNQTGPFLRVFDQFHQELSWLTASDIRVRPAEATEPTDNITGFSCFTGNYDGNRGDTSFPAGAVLVNRASPDNVAFILGRQQSTTIGTFDITNNDSNCHGMSGVFSWADSTVTSTATADAEGWDDYQEGNSLSDQWGTLATGKNQRGSAAYIMIRSSL
jgi:hypothetical protein